jgi:hypothetical protein
MKSVKKLLISAGVSSFILLSEVFAQTPTTTQGGFF